MRTTVTLDPDVDHALAIEQGAELCSRDTGFARFEGLRWRPAALSARPEPHCLRQAWGAERGIFPPWRSIAAVSG